MWSFVNMLSKYYTLIQFNPSRQETNLLLYMLDYVFSLDISFHQSVSAALIGYIHFKTILGGATLFFIQNKQNDINYVDYRVKSTCSFFKTFSTFADIRSEQMKLLSYIITCFFIIL